MVLSIREAEAEGLRNVGLGFLPYYCDHLLNGAIVGGAVPEIYDQGPGRATHHRSARGFEWVPATVGWPERQSAWGHGRNIGGGAIRRRWSHEMPRLITEMSESPQVGQFYLAIDPVKFGGTELPARLEVMLNEMLSQDGVRLPGDSRISARKRGKEDGILLLR